MKPSALLARLPWPRSLIARMTLLSVLLLVLAVAWFAVTTHWRYRDADPLAITQAHVRAELVRVVAVPEQRSDSLAGSEFLQEVARVNERFRYFVSRGAEQAQHGDPPRHLALVPQLRAMLERMRSETSSAFWSTTLRDEGATTMVSFRVDDGVESYFEFSGVDVPVANLASGYGRVSPELFWWTFRDPLIAGGGVMLIAFVVMLLAVRSLRALSRAADAIDATSAGRHLLPEEGLPSEVATLVRAVNEMIRRVDAAHDQQELFLATAAHELRTPMAVLRLRLEEVADCEAKETLRDDVRRMATLVEQLLRLMRIRNSRSLPDRVDLVAAARDVVAERAPLGVDRGVDIELVSEPGSPVVDGHRELVGVAIANLLDNAISFSKPGDTLRVSVDDGGTVAVADRGPGLCAGDVERIFEPFAKGAPNRRGHGLGLAIVRAVMTAHGGTVSARNGDAGGATFTLRFAQPALARTA